MSRILQRFDSPLRQASAIVGVGVLARLALFFLQHGMWYFPDSVCYVGGFNFHPGCTAHPVGISWAWQIGTFLQYTERNVAILQTAVGLLGVLFFFLFLRSVVRTKWAVIFSLIWAVFPLELLFERTYLSESIVANCLVFSLWMLSVAQRTLSPWRKWSAVAVSLLVQGATVDMKTSLEFPAVAFLLLTVWYFATSATELRRWSVLSRLGLLVVLLVSFAVPVLAIREMNKRAFHDAAIDSNSGSFIFARWAPLVSCKTTSNLLPPVVAAVHQVCGTKFQTPPGNNVEGLLWHSGAVNSTMNPGQPQFALVQKQLTHLAESGILHHPVSFLSQVALSFEYQLFRPLVVEGWGYDNGGHLVGAATPLTKWTAWFGGATTRPYSTLPNFHHVLNVTSRWPQYLLWLIGAGLITLAVRRGESRPRHSGWWWRWLISEKEQSHFYALVLGVYLFLAMASTAAGSIPSFRYFVNLIPVELVLLALIANRALRHRA